MACTSLWATREFAAGAILRFHMSVRQLRGITVGDNFYSIAVCEVRGNTYGDTGPHPRGFFDAALLTGGIYQCGISVHITVGDTKTCGWSGGEAMCVCTHDIVAARVDAPQWPWGAEPRKYNVIFLHYPFLRRSMTATTRSVNDRHDTCLFGQ